ncbi:MAG: serine/threonine-protein kinase [Limisphaerales bacterium]
MQFNKSAPANDATPQPGRFGRFYLQELINRGGVSEVWVATDPESRTYALRRMWDNRLLNFVERKRFFHGCEILAQIHHEFIVKYVEHGKIEGTPYLLMDYVAGSNLKLLLSRGDEVLAENVAQIVIDMAVALEQVHDSGFIHLDFKPENILVTPNANIRLIDFDLARSKLDEPQALPHRAGTPAYMAPERLQHEGVDQRADIFAVGVTVYEVLTGAKPFPGDSPDEILRKQLSRDMARPRDLNPDIPASLEKVIMKCLEPDMADRYPYMSVVVRDLQAALYV